MTLEDIVDKGIPCYKCHLFEKCELQCNDVFKKRKEKKNDKETAVVEVLCQLQNVRL
jgi:hypothetical protein